MSVDADVRVDDLDADLGAVALPALPGDEPADVPTATPQEGSPPEREQSAPVSRGPLFAAWSPFIGLAVVLALVSIFVTSSQAQWLAAIGVSSPCWQWWRQSSRNGGSNECWRSH